MSRTDEIAYPHPEAVKRLRRLYALTVLAMTFVFWCFWRWANSRLSASVADPQAIRGVFAVLSLAIAGPALAFGVWIFVVCRRALRAQQWPHPGARLERPVRVLRGRDARVRAWIVLSIGVFIAAVASALSVYLYFDLGVRFEELSGAAAMYDPAEPRR